MVARNLACVTRVFASRISLLFLVVSLTALFGCSQSPDQAAATAIAAYNETATAAPTATPSITSTSTSTSTSTNTPTATSIPSPTPSITPEPTPTPEFGTMRLNESEQKEVWIGDRYLEAPVHYKPEYIGTDEEGRVHYDAPGLHLFINKSGAWQVTPFEQVEWDGFEVVFGAGGEYQITSDETKANERLRELFVSWVQAEANADYRKEIFGAMSVTDEQVWEFISANGLEIRKSLEIPYINHSKASFTSITRFTQYPEGFKLSANNLGLVIIFEDQWELNQYGIRDLIESQEKVSGNLHGWIISVQMRVDKDGQAYIVLINHGVPEGYRDDGYEEDKVYGGHDSTAQPSDPQVATQDVETIINIFKIWRERHLREGGLWLYSWGITVEEWNKAGGNARGSYGAYVEQIVDIYGENSFLIESVGDSGFNQ